MGEIVNKVAQSGIITIDPETLISRENIVGIDIAGQLWQGLVLREKDFREWISGHDWSAYRNQHVAIYCSADAIIPHWAFMLIASALSGIAATVSQTRVEDLKESLLLASIQNIDISTYENARVVVKGCGDEAVPASAYVALVQKLQPVVKSIMFGEPCSTVPVYKRKS
jgi:S-adenosylmethionine/arginine decarboxylase-like enzyme